jgi:hypothetical protein
MKARGCPDTAATTVGRSRNQGDDKAALLHERAEVLTALGNYLAASHRRLEDQPDPPLEVSDILAKSLKQCERADEALRQLNRISRRETAPCDNKRADFR